MGKICSRHKVAADEDEEIDNQDMFASKSMFALKYAIGKSRYGLVWNAIKKSNKREYAVKVMDKATVFNLRSVDCILNELKIVSSIRSPFIVNVHYAF
jgi:serine/threonine protein kinase